MPRKSRVEFTYDGLGRCLKRTINGVSTIFLYDGWKPVIEYDHWGNFVAWNTYGPGADEILYRCVPDGQGGGGGGQGGGTGTTGFNVIYHRDSDTYEIKNVVLSGWWYGPQNVMGQWAFLPITTNNPNARLARTTNWIAARHPELQPRQNPAVPVRNAASSYNWAPWPTNRQITIDPAQNTTEYEYFRAYTHELLHAQDSYWRNFWVWASHPKWTPGAIIGTFIDKTARSRCNGRARGAVKRVCS